MSVRDDLRDLNSHTGCPGSVDGLSSSFLDLVFIDAFALARRHGRLASRRSV